MTSLLCIHTHSKHTHTHTLARNRTHNYLYTQMCPGTFAHTHTVGVYTDTHTLQVWITGRQESTEILVLPDGVCNVCDYRFGVFDLWCCLACVSACVFVFAYMCGRLVLPCFFSVFLVFFMSVVHWIALQTAGPRPCLPSAMSLLKKAKKHPQKH